MKETFVFVGRPSVPFVRRDSVFTCMSLGLVLVDVALARLRRLPEVAAAVASENAKRSRVRYSHVVWGEGEKELEYCPSSQSAYCQKTQIKIGVERAFKERRQGLRSQKGNASSWGKK